MSEPEQRFLARLEQVMEANYAGQDFSIADMASALALSPWQLQRKLKALTDQQPIHYLRLYRLKRSLNLLRKGKLIGEPPRAPAKPAWRFARSARSLVGVPISACGGKLSVIAGTRHGFTRALLGLRPNRTLVLACTEDPPLIAKILAHVRQSEGLFDSTPCAPPDSRPLLNLT